MEDGLHTPEEYAEGRQSTWKLLFLIRLTLSASIGGLIFGYDAGVISGASLFVQAIVGAIVGAAIGGWISDSHGRRTSILVADLLSIVGAIIMAFAPVPRVMIIGRILMGLGVGILSMASPLYISEASPTRIRGALVGTNWLLYTVGNLLFYLTNLAFTKAPGTWRWLVGVGGIPALVQLILMFLLPESPREEEAVDILLKISPQHEVSKVVESLKALRENKIANPIVLHSRSMQMKECVALTNRGILTGILYHMSQQYWAVSMKLVLYRTATGFASNKMVLLALPLVTSGLGVLGSIVTITFVDRIGRRPMMVLSVLVTFLLQFVLVPTFMAFGNHPSKYVLLCVGAFIFSYSTGIATVAWIVSSEVYPLRNRGMCAGIAAVSYWVFKLLVNPLFLVFKNSFGPDEAMLLFAPFSAMTGAYVMLIIPETKRLPLEEVENMLIRLLESEKKPIESSQALPVPDSARSRPRTCQAGGAR
ncbi:hypothetical protein HHK36_027308 [Tetracentron sinense]|uniref:Major facilitator superfamily (MFS) profile domain-containing protein n=1 Tax=Tetracentron sinense TaxID=13715 RepID=A0A834YK79_TETSI|nr:hypothetical protein HHK36_027308 [Tetracentron sinense]